MRKRFTGRLSLLILSFAIAILAFPAMAMAATTDTSGATAPAPTIQSDQADYNPGATVTLTGSGWQPGESVHINVNDQEGQTWSRDVDVTADASGNITDQFQLPTSFVAVYAVTATGAQSGVATTTFTDGNLLFRRATADQASPAPSTWSVNWNHYSGKNNPFVDGTKCDLSLRDATGTTNYSGDTPTQNNSEPSVGNNQSAIPTSVSASGGYTFTYWSLTAAGTTHATAAQQCVAGNGGGTLYAHFEIAPKVSSINRHDSDPTNAGSVQWDVTFSQSVTGVDSGDFSLAKTGLGGTPAPQITNVTGSGTSYTVTVSTGSASTGDGTLGLNLVDDDSIAATADSNNKLGGPGTTGNGNGSFTGQTYTIDRTAPTVTIVSTSPATLGASGQSTITWHATENSAYSVRVGGTDCSTGNQVASGNYTTQPNNVTSTVNATDLSEGSNTIRVSVTDTATNTGSQTTTITKNSDTTAPTSTASATVPDGPDAGTDPDPYTDGSRTNQSVSVTLSASDNAGGSGVKQIVYSINGGANTTVSGSSVSLNFTTDGVRTISFHAVDNNLNTETPDNTFVVKVDKTNPVANCTSAPTTWSKDDVSIRCQPTDAPSGLANTADGDFNLSTTLPAGTETNTASTGSRTVTDQAGNTVTAGPISGNMVDEKAPSTSASTGAYNGGWTNQSVTVTLSANDGGSDVDKTEYKVDGGPFQTYNGAFTVGSDGDHTITYRSTDKVGNQEADQTLNVKVDKTPPQFSCDQPDGNWHGSDVTLNCTASDSSSGLANPADGSFPLSTSVAAGDETASASTDSKVLTDAAGNSVTAGPISGNKVDKKAPAVVPGDVNDTTWRNSPRSEDFTASDGGSGLANASDESFTLSASAESADANTPTVVSRTVKDAVGNATTRTVSALIDLHNPNINATVLNQPDANTGWYNISTGGPQVHFNCSDVLSGIAAGACPADHSVTQEGASVNYSGSVSDRAGNSATDSAGPFKIDLTRPAAAGAPDLLATSDSGTSDTDNLTNVKAPTFDITAEAGSTVKLFAQKVVSGNPSGTETLIGQGTATSGTARITSNQDLADGDYKVYAHVTDQAGNESDTSVLNITIVSIDSTPPDAPGLSMAAASDTGVSNSDNKTKNDTPTFGGSAEANSTLKATATDAAGNTSSASQLSVMIDKTAPAANCGTPPSAWSGTDVSIRCQPTDALSGLADPTNDGDFNLSTNVAANTETNSASTGSRSVSDVAGNSVTAGPFTGLKVDKKAPAVNCSSADGVWHAADVSIGCTASDGGSGLANAANDASFNLSTNVAAGTETANASTGSRTVTDAVGNSAQAGPISGNKVDNKAPTFGNCPAGGPFQLNSGGTQHAQSVGPIPASDGGSLVDNANSTLSGTVNTSTVGKKSVTFTAKGNVGNQSSTSCDYYVDYLGGFGGILQPINGGLTPSLTADGMNLANAAFSDDNSRFKLGSTVPVKFTLTDATGAPVTGASANLYLKKADNSPDAGVDEAVSTAASTTGNLFRYDATSGQYIFNLSTKNTYVNVDGSSVAMGQGTYTITVKLDDGTSRSVDINVVK